MSDNNPRFTPRPWRAEQQQIGDSYVVNAVVKDGQDGEPGFFVAKWDGHDKEQVDENWADMQLMACSPDFYHDEEDKINRLTELKNQILSLIGTGLVMPPVQTVTSDSIIESIDEMIKDTKELLARARGGEAQE